MKRSLNGGGGDETTTRTTPLGERLAKARKTTKSKALQKLSASAKAATQRKKLSQQTGTKKKKKHKKSGKLYRRVKVLRWWVKPAIFFVPLGILLIEYYLDRLIGLEDVRDVYYQQVGMDPWDADAGPLLGTPRSIANTTAASRDLQCPGELRRMINMHNPKFHFLEEQKIPRMVHQRGASRCLTRKFYTSSVQWASKVKRWSYYFHDDLAAHRLLYDNTYPEFPLLKTVLSSSVCLPQPVATASQLGSDLWAFLTMWVFGGIYADLNSFPEHFSEWTIQQDDDAVLWLDSKTDQVTTHVMAATPRHPIMYYAVERILDHIVFGSGGNNFTGSMALQQACRDFQQQPGGKLDNSGKIYEGAYIGANKRKMHIRGVESGLIKPVFEFEEDLAKEYAAMGSALPSTSTNSSSGDCLRWMNQS
jgi:hypothetical protein